MEIKLLQAVLDTEKRTLDMSTDIGDVSDLREYMDTIILAFARTGHDGVLIRMIVEILAALELTTHYDFEEQLALLSELSRRWRPVAGELDARISGKV